MRRNAILMLIGDEPTRDLLTFWLSQAGGEVTQIDDADDVGARLMETDAGVLLTDRLFGMGTGGETIAALKDRFPGLRLAVVPVRSYLPGDMERLARVVGADSIVNPKIGKAAAAGLLS